MTSIRALGAGLLLATFASGAPTGPTVGAKAYDFELKDQKGVQRNLTSVLGPKGALLVFYRSCDW